MLLFLLFIKSDKLFRFIRLFFSLDQDLFPQRQIKLLVDRLNDRHVLNRHVVRQIVHVLNLVNIMVFRIRLLLRFLLKFLITYVVLIFLAGERRIDLDRSNIDDQLFPHLEQQLGRRTKRLLEPVPPNQTIHALFTDKIWQTGLILWNKLSQNFNQNEI